MDGKLDAGCLAERLTGLQNEYWLHLDAKSPLEKYPAKQHARRVQEKLGVDEGLIYLPGEVARNNTDSDMPAPFRQRRYFYYLTGCNEPGCHLTYDIETDTLALFIPRIDPQRVIWYGRGSTPAEALDKYDIDQVFYVDQLHDYLQNWAKLYRGSLYVLNSEQGPQIPGLHEQIDADSLRPAVNLARVVKDEHEIRLIKKANDISSRAHKVVLANVLRFKNEAQVEGLFLNVCISKQAKQQAYDIIAASGPNAGTLHYDSNDEDFDDRQLMCLDAGCEYELYASDITRTFPLSGNWPSVEAKNIYQLVQRMQETCIQGLKPGVRYLDLHILAHQIAIDGLLSLGILHNGTREEIYKAGTSKAFFPHGLGHHVGLEVHDVGQGELMSVTKGNPKYEMAPSVFPKDYHLSVYDPELCRSPVDTLSGHLEEGMVVTVEPGIYFSAYSLNTFYLPSPVHSKYINVAAVKRYLPVGGVRIEDDLLITRKGYENLTTAPKGEAMLEIIRSQNAQWPFISESSDLGPTAREDVDREEPLLRAPGLPRHTPEPVPKPLVRSSTAPVQRRRDGRTADAVDFEPFNGPSLYTNFKRSRTTDENVQRWKDSSRARSTRGVKNDIRSGPMCGESSPAFAHAYLDFPTDSRSGLGSGPPRPQAEKKPACKKCTILVEALDRLRDNLNKSEQNSPRPSAKAPKGGMFAGEEKMLFTEPLPIRTARAVPLVGLGVVTDAMNKNLSMVPVTEAPGHVHPFSRGPVSRASLPTLKSPPAHVDSQTLFELSGGQGKAAPARRACKHCEGRKLVCRPVHSLPACGECVLGFRAWDCDVAEKSQNPTTPTKPAISAEMLARMMQTPPPSNQSVAPETAPAPLMHLRPEKSCIHCRRSKVNCTWDPSHQACRACIASDRPCIILNARIDPESRISASLVPLDPNPAKVSNRDFRASLPAVIDSRYASFQPRASYSSPEPMTALTATPTVAIDPPTTAHAQAIRPRPISMGKSCSLCTTLCTPCHRTTHSGACQTCTLNGFLCPDAPATETLMEEVRHRCRTCHKRRMTCHDFSFYVGCKCCERDGFVCEMPSVRGMYLNGLGVELRARALMGALQGSTVQPREDAGDQGKENLPWGDRD